MESVLSMLSPFAQGTTADTKTTDTKTTDTKTVDATTTEATSTADSVSTTGSPRPGSILIHANADRPIPYNSSGQCMDTAKIPDGTARLVTNVTISPGLSCEFF
ncbi:uncharacterized protein LTR77_006019 [Saxophila tyrrhenica]|uniref:Uncharacterized protein n=1 Tax=Saxophila tyrrhenica TaxID=1690608 RepID=A0AAV9PAV7_9PEZI|nr:hypothetical protein LTR77_006019 [Saxophila tyrrhenica]